MDTVLTEPSSFLSELRFNHGSILIPQYMNLGSGLKREGMFSAGFLNKVNDPSPPCSTSSETKSPEDGDSSTSNSILKFKSEILMEEDLDEKPCMLQDCLALQAAEKSFYDVLNQEYDASSSDCCPSFSDSAALSSLQACSSDSSSTCSCHVNSSAEAIQHPELGNLVATCVHLTSAFADLDWYNNSRGRMGENIFFKYLGTSGRTRDAISEGSQNSVSGSSEGKKSHGREEGDSPKEGRSNKQSAVSVEEPEQQELFDEVLLCQPGKDGQSCSLDDDCEHQPSRKSAENRSTKGSDGRSGGRRKKNSAKGEVVDPWTLLTQCAQAVAINDHRSSMELIRKIRQHSSHHGDGNQRLAYYFVNGLEARLAGTEAPSYLATAGHGTPAADILKAYQFYVQACPFKRMSNFFSNRTIMRKADTAKSLHIIDFGILYGFQWPCLIQRISKRSCGLTKIRMTGIELPQPGFRPAERVEETGRRLKKYCERFGVQFEYNTIAKKWETIQLEDLKIDCNDFIVVNCLYRLRNLPDESVVMNSPRDTVLKLIRKMEPDLFVHGVVNGTYNAPFFLTRFKEALFHFSSLFDMFDVGQDNRENEQRVMFEKEVFGRDAMNVIACEGVARVERPETYKQWQVRNTRAGFRQIPPYEDIFKNVKRIVKSDYHRDFVIDQDGHWVLLGWKGRVIHAVLCWVPA
ncbi:hypothetical protein SAY87_013917 [Trapa incisa]|uniref:Uncharacterized protein n=1 Tax=Trapa incisa TaxID=236973 RepID=A0AAN7QDN4_9MYRT|nr:hypothetical protein SAY87_013917 [Trapa incisa]